MAEEKLSLTIQINSETGQLELVSQKLDKTAVSAKKADNEFSDLSKTSKNLLAIFGATFGAATVANFFKTAIKDAAEYQESLRRLKFNLEAAGISFKSNSEEIKKWADQIQRASRFSDDQALGALERFVRVTGNLNQAQNASVLAMNLAVASSKDLASVQEILVDLINGNERGVSRATREFGAFTGTAKTAQEVLDILSQKFTGVNEVLSKDNGFTSNVTKLQNAFADLGKEIGTFLIEKLDTLIGKAKTAGEELSKVSESTWRKWGAAATLGASEILRETKKLYDSILKITGVSVETHKEAEKEKTKETKKEVDTRIKVNERALREDNLKVLKSLEIQQDAHIKNSKEYLDLLNKESKIVQDLTEATTKKFAADFGKAVADSIVSGKNFEDAMKNVFENLISYIIQAIAQMLVLKALTGTFTGGGITGGLLGMLAAPGAGGIGGARGAPGFGGNSSDGGAGGQTVINVNLSTTSLNLSDRKEVLNALADEIAKKTTAARQFSSRVVNLSRQNSGRSV